MLFTSIFAAFAAITVNAQNVGTKVGSVGLRPIDYEKYSKLIDLQTVKYYPNGTVFIFDTTVKTISNETEQIQNSTITLTGQFEIHNDDKIYYLDVDPLSGLVSVNVDGGASNGIFFIDNQNIFFNYHNTFLACQSYEGSNQYNLFWRGASSVAVCENDWLLANLKGRNEAGAVISGYKPDNYQTSIAETATENTATTTATVGTQESKTVQTTAKSSNGGAAISAQFSLGAGLAALAGMLL